MIIGGGGGDSLFGSTGADTFRYLAASDSTSSTYDIIQDFESGIDKVDLTAAGRGSDKLALLNDATTSYLFVDLGGDGINDMQLLFATPNVRLSDFLI